MILDGFADPVELWQYAERYLGEGTRSYSPFAADLDIAEAYHPQRGKRSFALPTFWVRHDAGEYLSNTIRSDLHELYRQEERFLLPVHPETLAMPGLAGRELLLHLPTGPVLEVVPSANARTTFVVSADGSAVPPHFLKLHFPKRSSRFTRRLRRPIISLHLWVADQLNRIDAPFLPEVGGGVFGRDPREAWGYLVREPRPRVGRGLDLTVPLFALYGSDYRAPGDPTLLEQLVAGSGEPADDFLAQRIVRPMVRMWLWVVFSTGCALELHGQNTLFSFTRDGRESRIVYRDCAVYVDPALCELASTDVPEVNVISRDVAFPREQVFSLVYDSFMGHHALSFLARVARQRLAVDEAVLRAAAREEFAVLSGSPAVLPETIYYYEAELPRDGRWRLVDTGRGADWR